MKKAIIFGNGPALLEMDFDYLQRRTDIDTFACNRIDMIYEKTTWRPDYYFCFSTNLREREWQSGLERIVSNKKTTCFLSEEISGFINSDNVIYVKNLKEHWRNSKIPDNLFETDFEKQQIKSYSATVPMVQYCFSKKYSRISILGQDGYIYDKGDNHFDKSYGYESGNFERTNKRIVRLHEVIKAHSKNIGTEVSILTSNSVIKMHKRINIEDL